MVGCSVFLAHRNNLLWAFIITAGSVLVIALSTRRSWQRVLLLVVLPIAVVPALLVSALGAWAVWDESRTNEHMDRERGARTLCTDEAHRRHPEAKSLSVYIGDEFGDDHGLVLAELPDASGLLVWVHSGNGGFWKSCTIQRVDPISQPLVQEYLTTQPWALVTTYP
jgi:hypothetical protein